MGDKAGPSGRAPMPALSALLVLLLAGDVPAAAPAPDLASALAGLAPGQVVTVGSVGAIVPPPGWTVWVEALGPGTGAVVVSVTTRPDGSVAVAFRAATAGGAAGTAVTLPACQDAGFTPFTHEWTKDFRWRFKLTSTPAEIGRKAARAALKRAAVNIVRGDNDCDLDEPVEAGQVFAGKTGRSANVSAHSVCLQPDGRNVVSFGDLLEEHLALACWWTSGTEAVEGDIRFNKADYRWVVRIPSGCRHRWSVEAVATHEFGHLFGLDHVDETLHGELTMSPLIDACQASEKTLGTGDLLGLTVKY